MSVFTLCGDAQHVDGLRLSHNRMRIVNTREVLILLSIRCHLRLDEHIVMRKNCFLNGGKTGQEKLPPVVLDIENVAHDSLTLESDVLTRRADHMWEVIEAVLTHDDHSALQ